MRRRLWQRAARAVPHRQDRARDWERRGRGASSSSTTSVLRYGTEREVLSDLASRSIRAASISSPGATRRGQDLAAQAALSRAAALARDHPHVRHRRDHRAARPPARLSPPHRRGVPGLPAGPAPVGVRQRRAAAARLRACPKARSKPVADMLDWVGLDERAERAPGDAVGRRAAARGDRPRGDRPARDPRRRRADRQRRPGMAQLLRLFEALNRLGTTVVVATHDLGLIAATPGAQLIRLEKGARRSDRRAKQPAGASAARR